MTTQPLDKLEDLLEDFSDAMLVTSDHGKLRARPMHVADRQGAARLTFAAGSDSDKVLEVIDDEDVAVTLQSGSKFVSITGIATISQDRSRIRDLWNKAWDLWFEGGAESASVALIDVTTVAAEYWDMSGSKRLSFVVEAGKALLNDRTINPRELDGHGKV